MRADLRWLALVKSFECGDLSPLFLLCGLTLRLRLSSVHGGRDRSQPAKAVTGHRTPKACRTSNVSGVVASLAGRYRDPVLISSAYRTGFPLSEAEPALVA
jgi:hypothetical protein